MNFEELKKKIFIVFGACIFLLVVVAILGIWEVIDRDFAWKSLLSLSVIGFAILFLLTIGQKLFEKKGKNIII